MFADLNLSGDQESRLTSIGQNTDDQMKRLMDAGRDGGSRPDPPAMQAIRRKARDSAMAAPAEDQKNMSPIH